jgi:cellulose biosynthesis protein BcsQ
MIVTFYSFKGGVGRTLALANIGVILAQNGHRVLAIDFDLEAPGLTRYLENVFGGDLQLKCGLLELLERQRDEGDAVELLQQNLVEVLRPEGGGVLDLITSGHQNKGYPARILGFDWASFFREADGGDFFERCRHQWSQQYDFVLIDSRTGITDSGGICTIQLPDLIVPVFTASRQSVEGVIDVMLRAQEGRQLLAYDRAPAAVVPLASRFDSRTEYALSQQWLDEFAAQFGEFYSSWLPKDVSVKRVIERTKLPYVAFFSFGERLPVLEETGSDPESLSYALRTFARLLESNLKDAPIILTSSTDVAAVEDHKREPVESTDRGIGRPGRNLIHTTSPPMSGSQQDRSGSRDPAAIADHAGPSPDAQDPLLADSRRDRRRRARITAILSMLLVLAVVAAGVAIFQQRMAEERQQLATARLLLSQAEATVANDPRLALRLGEAAVSIHLDQETQAGLAQLLSSVRFTGLLEGHTGAVTGVAFAPDGHTLATAGADGTALLWDVTNPSQPRRSGSLTGHTGAVNGVAFAPDGHTLATAGADGTALLWDVTNPSQPRRSGDPLTGYTGAVNGVAFAPDGRTLATAGADGAVLLWDVTDPSRPRPLGKPLTGHTDAVTAVAFAPDGQTLATASTDSTALLWELGGANANANVADPLARACALSGGGLNPDEWARYVPDLPYVRSCPV